MALTIEGATHGVDTGGIAQLINDLKLDMVDNVISSMDKRLATLQTEVDAAWQGTSAEQFKTNMQIDKDNISKLLRDSEEELKKYLYDIANSTTDQDEEIATSIARGE